MLLEVRGNVWKLPAKSAIICTAWLSQKLLGKSQTTWNSSPFIEDLIYPLRMVIFHSYVSLPEGIPYSCIGSGQRRIQCWMHRTDCAWLPAARPLVASAASKHGVCPGPCGASFPGVGTSKIHGIWWKWMNIIIWKWYGSYTLHPTHHYIMILKHPNSKLILCAKCCTNSQVWHRIASHCCSEGMQIPISISTVVNICWSLRASYSHRLKAKANVTMLPARLFRCSAETTYQHE